MDLQSCGGSARPQSTLEKVENECGWHDDQVPARSTTPYLAYGSAKEARRCKAGGERYEVGEHERVLDSGTCR